MGLPHHRHTAGILVGSLGDRQQLPSSDGLGGSRCGARIAEDPFVHQEAWGPGPENPGGLVDDRR